MGFMLKTNGSLNSGFAPKTQASKLAEAWPCSYMLLSWS